MNCLFSSTNFITKNPIFEFVYNKFNNVILFALDVIQRLGTENQVEPYSSKPIEAKCLDFLPEENKVEFQKLAQKIERLVNGRKREKIHRKAYKILKYDGPQIPHFTALVLRLVVDSKSLMSDIGDAILVAYAKQRLEDQDDDADFYRKRYAQCQKSPRVYYTEKNDDTLIEFSHGGGLWHIHEFLQDKTRGYPLEADRGLGIQVHPLDKDRKYDSRSTHYAKSGAPHHLDKPAILRGKIPGKYLEKAPNWYEAGIRSQFARYITDVKITELDYEISCFPLTDPSIEEINTFFTKEQIKRLRANAYRLDMSWPEDPQLSKISLFFEKFFVNFTK